MIKVTHNQSRTKQVKQYEPHSFSYTVEMDVEEGEVQKTMDILETVVSKKLAEDIDSLESGLK